MIFSFLAGSSGGLYLLAAETLSGMLGISQLGSLNRTLFYSFITIAGSSELGKFVVFLYMTRRENCVKNPIDAITCSIMTALGFASVTLIFFYFNLFWLILKI